jgi:hypothetical protein
MTFDYGAETPPSEFVNPPTLINCIGLTSGRVKLLNFQAKAFEAPNAAIPASDLVH